MNTSQKIKNSEMNIYEFHLRLRAYRGLSKRLDLGRKEDECMDFVRKFSHGTPKKKLNECSIDELKSYTFQTYTSSKKKFIDANNGKKVQGERTLRDYMDRIEYELYVTHQMGYNTYNLVVADFIDWARNNEIVVGPGRGSAAGSLLSYCIGITDIDPLIYDLLYERFLNPARISMPDVDTDFEDRERDRVIEYVIQKYGTENVAHIGTFMTMAAKAAFKDVARAKGMKFTEANRLSSLVTEKTLEKSITANEELQSKMTENPFIEETIDLARKLEGNVRQTGVHACGMIIAPDPVTDHTPVQLPPKADNIRRVVTQYDGHYLEDIGLIKMDFLGLRNLSIIKDTCKIIRAQARKDGKNISQIIGDFFISYSFNPPLNDEKTFENIFQTGNTSGVFQFESDGMRNRLRKLKPDNIDNIIAMVALYRPGPMEFIPTYINRKNGEEEVTYGTDELKEKLNDKYDKTVVKEEIDKLENDLGPFMDVTYGIPVYQEQLMRLVQAMAGFSLAEADLLRRGVGKKILDIVQQMKISFVERAQEYHGYKTETADYIYEKMIMPAADYSFNKSHAACYAIIAYQTAYLKTHYPTEFYAALLRSAEEDPERLSQLIDELLLQGVEVHIPNINQSFAHVAAIEGNIVLGFISLRGIGYEIGKYIETEREKAGNFSGLEDFFRRCPEVVNKKSIEALGKAGCFDKRCNRATILANISTIIERSKHSEEAAAMGGGLFGDTSSISNLSLKKERAALLSKKYEWEYDVFKTIVSHHPFDGLYSYVKKKYNFVAQMKTDGEFGQFRLLCIIRSIRKTRGNGVFITLEDITGRIDVFLKNQSNLSVMDVLHIEGYKRNRISVDMMIVYDLDQFRDAVQGLKIVKDNETVVQIRKKRIGNQNNYNFNDSKKEISAETVVSRKNNKKQRKSAISAEKNFEEDQGQDKNLKKYSTNQDVEKKENVFDLPENVDTLIELRKVIKSNPGNDIIKFGEKKFFISKIGLEKIYSLLN